MTAILTDTLNANDDTSVSAALPLITETIVSLYVFHNSGNNDNYRTVLMASPVAAGGNWRQVGQVINGVGETTITIAAQRVRAKIFTAEGTTSSITFHIVAK